MERKEKRLSHRGRRPREGRPFDARGVQHRLRRHLRRQSEALGQIALVHPDTRAGLRHAGHARDDGDNRDRLERGPPQNGGALQERLLARSRPPARNSKQLRAPRRRDDNLCGLHRRVRRRDRQAHDSQLRLLHRPRHARRSFCHLGARSALGNNVSVGDDVFVGMGAMVKPTSTSAATCSSAWAAPCSRTSPSAHLRRHARAQDNAARHKGAGIAAGDGTR